MKRFLPIIILFITNILSSQVMSQAEGESKLKKDMIGMHYSEVIKVLGSYKSKSEDGLGGIIYVWKSQTDEVQLFCDSDGVVYNVRYLNIPSPNNSWIYGTLLLLIFLLIFFPTPELTYPTADDLP